MQTKMARSFRKAAKFTRLITKSLERLLARELKSNNIVISADSKKQFEETRDRISSRNRVKSGNNLLLVANRLRARSSWDNVATDERK